MSLISPILLLRLLCIRLCFFCQLGPFPRYDDLRFAIPANFSSSISGNGLTDLKLSSSHVVNFGGRSGCSGSYVKVFFLTIPGRSSGIISRAAHVFRVSLGLEFDPPNPKSISPCERLPLRSRPSREGAQVCLVAEPGRGPEFNNVGLPESIPVSVPVTCAVSTVSGRLLLSQLFLPTGIGNAERDGAMLPSDSWRKRCIFSLSSDCLRSRRCLRYLEIR
jgi:hypothetical protein